MASVRFGVGRWTTAEEIDYAVEKVAAIVRGIRTGRSPASARG
jgi:hypothetical protein